MEFADKLVVLRRKEGMSQEQLADRLGVTRQSVSKWESGGSVPELAKLIALADLFGVTLDELVRNRTEPVRGSECVRAGDAAGTGFGRDSFGAERCRGGETETGRLQRRPEGIEREIHGYEYVSRKTIGGIPLVCIRFTPGRGNIRVAKGIIAIGNAAVGVVAIGCFSFGIISIGMIGMGLLALGGVTVGLLALGGVAIGLFAAGMSAIGAVSLGIAACGNYCCGIAAAGMEIAVGVHASGKTVVGMECTGAHVLQCYPGITQETVRAFLTEHHPGLPGLLADLFARFGAGIG